MAEPTVVAFLQNMWFRDPERAKKLLGMYCAKSGDGREAFIRDMLFWSCLTGRRIQQAFGEEACSRVVWEEVSPEIGGHSSSKFPPDAGHVAGVLRKHRPAIVLLFGAIAGSVTKIPEVVRELSAVEIIRAPHPAARGNAVVGELLAAAASLKAAMARAEEVTHG